MHLTQIKLPTCANSVHHIAILIAGEPMGHNGSYLKR